MSENLNKNEDSVQHIVTELRTLVETKSKESGEYKEKLEKLSVAFEQAESKNSNLVIQLNSQKESGVELSKKVNELETKFYRPQNHSSILIKTAAEEAFERALYVREKYEAIPELKAMSTAARQECIEKKYLRTDNNIDGGYLCPPEWSKEIVKKKIELTPMRALSKVVTISTKLFEQPVRNTLVEASYEGEAQAVTPNNSEYGIVRFVTNRLTAQVPVTYEMLNDGYYDIAAEIQADVALQFAKKEGFMFLKGSGTNQPFGIMNDTNIPTRNSTLPADISFDTIKLMTGDLKSGYNPTFILNRRTVAYLATLKNSIGAYLWQEGSTGDGVPSTLAGYPYVRAIDMDDVGANNYPILFGDFKAGYQIVDRFGLYVIRDEITQASKAMINYIFHTYNGGRTLLPEAFVKLRCHA